MRTLIHVPYMSASEGVLIASMILTDLRVETAETRQRWRDIEMALDEREIAS